MIFTSENVMSSDFEQKKNFAPENVAGAILSRIYLRVYHFKHEIIFYIHTQHLKFL